ncbi:MAG: hypothetical protein NTY75_04620 [Candidatus Shapirobacteria bacterium]|nr:hypothetical protein [Candidatus Shapirobacteria bacterium]
MKKYLFALSLVSLFLLNASSALADDEIRNMVVNLKGKGFTQTNYVDNLDSSNIIFGAKDQFQVQLRISNFGNRNQTNVVVKETLPGTATTDSGSFTIPQIAAGQDYVKNITLTVKDKPFLVKELKSSTIRYDITTDVGTQTGDYLTFFTNGGTKSTTVATQSGLPATGAASNILLGSGIALGVGLVAFGLRKAARGY